MYNKVLKFITSVCIMIISKFCNNVGVYNFNNNRYNLKILGISSITSQMKDKFTSRSDERKLIGYSAETKAYRVWPVNEKRTVLSRDVKSTFDFNRTSEYEEFLEINLLTV